MTLTTPLRTPFKATVASAALLLGTTAQAQIPETAKASAAIAVNSPATDSGKRICATDGKSGSRIARKVCRTAAEWELERQSRQQKAFDPHQRP